MFTNRYKYVLRFDGKEYGIKYLLDCLKVEENGYHKSIAPKI